MTRTSELEAALDAALAGRAALEADRGLMALHRKKVGMGRQAEAKHEEALKANHLLEGGAGDGGGGTATPPRCARARSARRGHRERRSGS